MAMCAPTSGPAKLTVEALQKIGIAESTPMAPKANPAIAIGALDANAASRNPTAAVRYAPARWKRHSRLLSELRLHRIIPKMAVRYGSATAQPKLSGLTPCDFTARRNPEAKSV